MLIFFKPWRHASDLRSSESSWYQNFSVFLNSVSCRVKDIIDNMQVFHECKDSRDDHFEKLQSSYCHSTSRSTGDGRRIRDDFTGSDNYEQIIMEHLENIDKCHSERIDNTLRKSIACLKLLESCGIIDVVDIPTIDTTPLGVTLSIPTELNDSASFAVRADDQQLEDIWKEAYDERKSIWKKHASQPEEERHGSEQPTVGLVSQASDLTTLFNTPVPLRMTFAQDINQESRNLSEEKTNIDRLVDNFTLNHEQACAFRIIAEHCNTDCGEQLRMYIAGQGGTGKSCILSTIQEFFQQRHESHQFRMASYTGVAAQNINRMTLHTALRLGTNQLHTHDTHPNRDLVAMWEGVDYLFIDEVSMLGCSFLADINQALIWAKGKTSNFGRINVIFAGDFCQLSPVGQIRLFSSSNTGPDRPKDHDGQMLWQLVDTVVILKQVMRQSGRDNDQFVSLLDRLCYGFSIRSTERSI